MFKPVGQSSHSKEQSTDSAELQGNNNKPNEPSSSVTNPVTEDEELKVGDKIIYVGKKYQE